MTRGTICHIQLYRKLMSHLFELLQTYHTYFDNELQFILAHTLYDERGVIADCVTVEKVTSTRSRLD